MLVNPFQGRDHEVRRAGYLVLLLRLVTMKHTQRFPLSITTTLCSLMSSSGRMLFCVRMVALSNDAMKRSSPKARSLVGGAVDLDALRADEPVFTGEFLTRASIEMRIVSMRGEYLGGGSRVVCTRTRSARIRRSKRLERFAT